MEEAVSHFRSNVGIPRGRLLEHLDYILYHMPFTGMARKAHRHFVDTEHVDLDPETRQTLYKETFRAKVEPGLLGAREVGNIYTGSVDTGIGEPARDRTGSGGRKAGGRVQLRERLRGRILHLPDEDRTQRNHPGHAVSGATGQKKGDHLRTVCPVVFKKSGGETLYHPAEVEAHKDPFTRFTFIGFKDHKRQDVRERPF